MLYTTDLDLQGGQAVNEHGLATREVPEAGSALQTVTALSLDVAGRCNMACAYCSEADVVTDRQQMAEEVMNLCLRFVSGRNRQKRCSLQFGGGEPLLNSSMLWEVGERVLNMGVGRPILYLTTNGTLIDDDTLKWLSKQRWHVKVSLDGPEPVHDRHRVWPDGTGSFKQVKEAVLRLLERMPDRVSIASVLYRGVDPAESFELMSDLGVRSLEFIPVMHYDPEFRLTADDLRRYNEFMNNYVRRYVRGEKMPRLIRFGNKVMRVMGYDTSKVSCGAGRFLLGVNGSGTIYPCLGLMGMDKYRLGTVYGGLEQRLLTEFVTGAGRPFNERLHCRQCDVAALCGGPCFACAELLGFREHPPPPETCSYSQVDVRAAVWLVNELSHVDPTTLLSFLPGSEYEVW